MRIGINGFGRIGRNFTKALVERHPDVEIAAVNDLTSAKECAHLFKYDCNYGTYAGNVTVKDDAIAIDGRTIKVLAERDPGKLPWKDLGRRRRHRIDRPLHRRGQGARAHRRRRREESDHLGAGEGRRHHDRARRQRQELRSGQAQRNFERVVHDQLSRTAVKVGRRRTGLGQGVHDDDPLLHQRSEHPRRTAQRYAPRAQRRHQHHPDLDRRRQGAVPDDSRSRRAPSTDSRCACRRRPCR